MTRSEAIDMLRQIASYLTAGNPVWRTEPIREACKMAIEALSAEPRWIPVSERLPEEYSTVLITIKTRYYDTDPWEYYTDVAEYFGYGWTMFNDWDEGQEYYIVAWMPLPQPWKGADNE